jgi:hypothetical protein
LPEERLGLGASYVGGCTREIQALGLQMWQGEGKCGEVVEVPAMGLEDLARRWRIQ